MTNSTKHGGNRGKIESERERSWRCAIATHICRLRFCSVGIENKCCVNMYVCAGEGKMPVEMRK